MAIIGVGKDNKFGHPNGNVIEMLENNETKIYRTDFHGEITLNVKNDGKIKVKTQL